MREIKFRAWEEVNKVMHLDFRFIKSGDEGNDWLIFTSDKQTLQDKHHPFDNPWFQQQFKIMQYTGLKDANGVNLFEGDVVSVAGTGSAEVKICPAYGVVFSDKDGFERHYIDCIAEGDHPTIVGNIYQHPELLK